MTLFAVFEEFAATCNKAYFRFLPFSLLIQIYFGLKKVKGPDIYIPPLTRKPKQQWFTIRSGVLTGTSIRLC